jgi:cytochrome c oxidase subunit III
MSDTAVQGPHGNLKLGALATGAVGTRTSGWWGMVMLIVTEAFLFAYLLFSYYYFALEYGRAWLPDELPSFRLSGPDTAILIASSLAAWFGEHGLRHGSRIRAVIGLAAALVLGLVFVGIQWLEWSDKPFMPSSHSYGSLYFVVTGFHMAHVVAGLLILAALVLWTALGFFDRIRMAPVSIGVAYWHFVDVVWLTIFFTFYVTPRIFWT